MAASVYMGQAILNHILRGVEMDMPEKIWVGLHVGTTPAHPATEVKTSQWPSYVRIDANAGEPGIDGAFTTPANKETKNTKQLLWPPFNGAVTITIGGISLWTQVTGGEMLLTGQLSQAKTLTSQDEIVIHVDGLKIQAQ